MYWGEVSRSILSWPWANIGACAAVVFAGAALIVSWRAAKDGKRSADASVKAADAAVASVEEARLSRRVAEQALLDQRAEAAERRLAEANRPRPSFAIERVSGNAYYLRNTGTGARPGSACPPEKEIIPTSSTVSETGAWLPARRGSSR